MVTKSSAPRWRASDSPVARWSAAARCRDLSGSVAPRHREASGDERPCVTRPAVCRQAREIDILAFPHDPGTAPSCAFGAICMTCMKRAACSATHPSPFASQILETRCRPTSRNAETANQPHAATRPAPNRWGDRCASTSGARETLWDFEQSVDPVGLTRSQIISRRGSTSAWILFNRRGARVGR
jgi:hypothetical protein